MLFEPRIERDPSGGVRLRLGAGERELLLGLLSELELLLVDTEDPAVRRLFPPAHEDRESEEQFRTLVRDGLVSGRLAALRAMQATLGSDVLGAEDAEAWLRALNDLRLVLGTRLDVSEEIDYEQVDVSEPEGRDLAVYGYLSWLQEELVDALADW